ncbi:MAG: MlaE family ABC transporter permease [Wenzhouxiangella sp.]
MTESTDFLDPSATDGVLLLSGEWRVARLTELERALRSRPAEVQQIDGREIKALDAAGAYLLLRLVRDLALDLNALSLREQHRRLLETVAQTLDEAGDSSAPVRKPWLRVIESLGAALEDFFRNALRLISFFGLVLQTLASSLFRPRQWRITATVHHMQATGLDALPLVALLSFLVGAVVAFLGATVLREFGAELFVVDLTTFAFLREFGVLLTAILLAGRTASAFTAQIGTMKSREEIDAIRTLGLDPVVLLVLPRLIALLIMLPLLSVVAVLSGLLGGLAVATLSLGMPIEMYVNRVYETATLTQYLTGLSKAPVFAAVIALVGCLEGFKVTGTAQSVGERTTAAVVQSISLVIVINALAALFFMEMGW